MHVFRNLLSWTILWPLPTQDSDEKLMVGQVLPPHLSDNVTVTLVTESTDPVALLSSFSSKGSLRPLPLFLIVKDVAMFSLT
jgi:hypothetical protein